MNQVFLVSILSNLNPNDFPILSILARRVGDKNLVSLKRKLKATGVDLDEETMRACWTQVPCRLEAVEKAKGGRYK